MAMHRPGGTPSVDGPAGPGAATLGRRPLIIVKRARRAHHRAAHNGAAHSASTWKIALADFMTAMFIVFMLLWLIKQAPPEQRAGIANYFSPNAASHATDGSGGVLGGVVVASPGALTTRAAAPGLPGGGPPAPQEAQGSTPVDGFPGAARRPRQSDAARENQASEIARAARQALQTDPQLRGLAQNVLIDRTADGLRFQLIDTEKREMFARGAAAPLPHTLALLAAIARVIGPAPNQIAVSGHTDAAAFAPGAAYGNWELSADRANASRRALAADGVADRRFASVAGRADRDPLLADTPAAPQNRRISIVLLDRPDAPPGAADALWRTPPGALASPVALAAAAPAGPLIPR